MTLKFNRVLEVVEVHVHAIFHRAVSAAVHELTCAQRNKLRRTQYSPSLPRGQ